MCTHNVYRAVTACGQISIANPNLDGSGATTSIYTAGPDGAEIEDITIKAVNNTSQGMVRLFIDDGAGSVLLYQEIPVFAWQHTSVVNTFQTALHETLILKTGQTLVASTEIGEEFNIIASGFSWRSCPCSKAGEGDCDDTRIVARSGVTHIDNANPNTDGTGAMNVIIDATGTPVGIKVTSVQIKATQSTTQGIVRLFVSDGTDTYLMKEVIIPAATISNVMPSFRTKAMLKAFIPSGFTLLASTERAEGFNVMINGAEWINCPC